MQFSPSSSLNAQRRSPVSLDEITKNQLGASNPSHSIFVSANAGSGKTHVLSLRVLRLLLEGVEPQKILCLTYTKAAAAEMALRVFNRLSEWTKLSDKDLQSKLYKDFDVKADYHKVKKARRLFAEALETPGGLKIQTVHAFCEGILHQFPLEAGISSDFETLDDQEKNELILKAREVILADENQEIKTAIACVQTFCADQTFLKIIDQLLGESEDFLLWVDYYGNVEKAVESLREDLELDPNDNPLSLLASFQNLNLLKDKTLRMALLEALDAATGKNAPKQFKLLDHAFSSSQGDFLKLFSDLNLFFLKKTGDMRAQSRWFVKDVMQTLGEGDLHRVFEDQERYFELDLTFKKLQLLEANKAIFTLGEKILRRYQQEKNQRSKLDFSDLISAAKTLLERDNMAASWVHYKLDNGIEHILVDEAQDTSPGQWRILRALSDEIFAGEGNKADKMRSFFAVGDKKQSIYSFQGAAPDQFEQEKKYYQNRALKAKLEFNSVPLQASFRSLPEILSLVDQVFNQENVEGVYEQDQATQHFSLLHELPQYKGNSQFTPAHIEFWPLIQSDVIEQDPLSPDYHENYQQNAKTILAQNIADRIENWLKYKAQKPLGGAINPGDILILVQSRDAFVTQLIRALKRKNIPVAGADRLNIAAHIVTKDLMALMQVMLLSDDDLTLASLLKSPLFRFDDEDLLTLCSNREGTLWHSLYVHAKNDEKYKSAFERLSRWQSRLDYISPYAFFAQILGEEGGRREFVKSLGIEAHDVIDRFLDLALNFEINHIPTLHHFLDYMHAGTPALKRELEHADEVRIMTVHGAKGLEAPIVFLADADQQPNSRKLTSLYNLDKVNAQMDSIEFTDSKKHPPKGFFWEVNKGLEIPLRENLKSYVQNAQIAEKNRLLYVALTRASQGIFICGTMGKKTNIEKNWYGHLIDATNAPTDQLVPRKEESKSKKKNEKESPELPPQILKPFIYSGNQDGFKTGDTQSIQTKKPCFYESLPQSIIAPCPLPKKHIRHIRPSQSWDELNEEAQTQADIHANTLFSTSNMGESVNVNEQRQFQHSDFLPITLSGQVKGNIFHLLLQILPLKEKAEWHDYIKLIIQKYGISADDNLIHAFYQRIETLLSDQYWSKIFALPCKNEVSLQGFLPSEKGETLYITGQVDKLVFQEDEIILIDFKSDQYPPNGEADIPAPYKSQLEIYQKLLTKIYPDYALKAAILWIETASASWL